MKQSLLVAVLLAVALSACGKKDEAPADASSPPAESSAPADMSASAPMAGAADASAAPASAAQ